jgi:uncharacterized protein (DUF433 family)
MPTPVTIEPLAADDPRNLPLFTISEAAKYLGLSYTTLRSWVRPDTGKALVYSFTKEGNYASIPFVGFAEAFVLAAAKRHGLKPRNIRQGVAAVRKDIGLEYALATQRLFMDKTELLLSYADDDVPATAEDLTVARNRQLQLRETIKNDLRLITYGRDDVAETIQLPIFKKTKVIVDPREAFGQPIVERTGTRVRDVLALWWAEEDMRDIAYDFDLEPDEVEDIVRAQTKPPAD